jgi:type IV pilus assembly protein PilM
MGLLTGTDNNFFGLDIGTTGVRLVKLSGAGQPKTLQTYAYMPLDNKVALSDSKADQHKLGTAIKSLVSKSGVHTNNVAVGLPSQRVFTTVVDIDRLSKEELAKTIKFQADSLIPTPIAESKIDWELLGDSPQDKSKIEILLSSVPNNYIESRLDMLEMIGLNVIAFEPDSLALARSLSARDVAAPQMILDMGNTATDLLITVNGAPRLTRSIPTATQAIIRSAVQNLNIDEAQATQFVSKFGLNPQKLEGQIYHAISGTVDMLMSEIDKSIKFFNARYTAMKLDKIIVSGGAATLPEFPVYLANKFNINVEIGNAWRNVSYSQDRQNELAALSNQFAVAVGLAERI